MATACAPYEQQRVDLGATIETVRVRSQRGTPRCPACARKEPNPRRHTPLDRIGGALVALPFEFPDLVTNFAEMQPADAPRLSTQWPVKRAPQQTSGNGVALDAQHAGHERETKWRGVALLAQGGHMDQFTFSRSIGVGIGAAALLGALLTGGCGSSSGVTQDSPVSESEQALRARRCDGPLHLRCADGQYCNAAQEGLCPGRRQTGVCAIEPQICPDIFKPVCGCDDQTYPNSCNAAAAGVAIAHDGACATPVACGGILARPCPGNGKCVDDPSDDCDPANGGADCGGICSCVQTELCVRGSHFDNAPTVCKCVPDVTPVTCGKATCPSGQVCCNASCGVCTPPGFACSQIACTN
jgi:hypothetical protein